MTDEQYRIKRLELLLEGALETVAKRTQERDDALARLRAHQLDASAGYALRQLEYAVTRLRQCKPCPTMGFDPADCEDNAKSIVSEVDELLAEEAGSVAAKSEVRDILTIAINLAQGHRLFLVSGMLAQADKLNLRIDRMEAGMTWAEAKEAERDHG